MSDKHPDAETMNAYLLDELEPTACDALAAHLERCAACRETVSRLRSALALYREAQPANADEDALARLLRVARHHRRERPRWTTVAAAAAAAVVVFMGGFWAGRSDATREPLVPASSAPAAAPASPGARPDRAPPPVTFAAADADLLGGLAPRDTTWN